MPQSPSHRYTGQRLWEVDLTILHQIGTSPLPFFHNFEYAQLRLLGDACDAFGDAEVYDLIDRILRLRFRKNSLLMHMLHSGLLDPIYNDDKSSGWRSNTPSDLEGADVLSNPDSSPVEQEVNAKANVSATSKPEDDPLATLLR
ncbi:hypothetical protein C8J57DRAFT_1226872 [Mycena rebaudengoi]|nr:hypothetical protein C8J57DRAFT_1226872 [Mycena rebaudengoi]